MKKILLKIMEFQKKAWIVVLEVFLFLIILAIVVLTYLNSHNITISDGRYRPGDATYNVLNLKATVFNYGFRGLSVTSDGVRVVSNNGQVAGPVVYFDERVEPFASRTFDLQFNLTSGDLPAQFQIEDMDLNNTYSVDLERNPAITIQEPLNDKYKLTLKNQGYVKPTESPEQKFVPTVVVTAAPNATSDYEKDNAELVASIDSFLKDPQYFGKKVVAEKVGLELYLPTTNDFFYHETQPLTRSDEGEGTYETNKDCFQFSSDKLTPGNNEMYCKYYKGSYRFYSQNRWQSFEKDFYIYVDSYPIEYTSLLGDKTKYSEETVNIAGQQVVLRSFKEDSWTRSFCVVALPNGRTIVVTAYTYSKNDLIDSLYSTKIIKQIISSMK